MAARASRPAPGSDRGIAGRRGPSRVEELARFVCRSRWEQISEPAREQLRLRVLDSLGVALGALEGEPVAMVREQVEEFGGAPLCTLIGGGRGAPDRAALLQRRAGPLPGLQRLLPRAR